VVVTFRGPHVSEESGCGKPTGLPANFGGCRVSRCLTEHAPQLGERKQDRCASASGERLRPPSTTTDDEQTGIAALELLEQRVLGAKSSKKEAEWRIRQALLGVTSVQCSVKTAIKKLKTENLWHWPSQSEVADALSLTRARVGQVLSADRNRWAKDPLLNSLRGDLYEQIQRLGGVVTVSEMIELTNLIRPAADTLDTGKQQRMASAIARSIVETETSLADPRFQLRRVGVKGVRPQLCAAPEGPSRQLGSDPFYTVLTPFTRC